MANEYRYVTPTDVDRFIQIPDTLEVDARSIVLTVEEDTMQKYDKLFKISDYVIYCEAPKDKFFASDVSGNSSMTWRYKIVQKIDENGQYVGPVVVDAHDPLLPLAEDASGNTNTDISLTTIIDAETAKVELGTDTQATRFVHYKQCNRFFKYSFKLGAEVNVPVHDAADQPIGSRKGQLYAVYLDKQSGAALPYWQTIDGSGNDQSPEVRQYYWADIGTELAALMPAGVTLVDPESGLITVTVAVPPDPEFLESSANIHGGSLAYVKDGANLDIRQVGDKTDDPSGNNLTNYTDANFVDYTTDANRALFLYWVVNPVDESPYLGEEMFAAYASVAMGKANGAIRPIRDIVDASGNLLAQPDLAEEVKEVHKFTFNYDLAADTTKDVVQAIRAYTYAMSSGVACPRMYLPVSKFIVMHENPTEEDVHNNGNAEFEIPFAYEVSNATNFNGDAKKSIMGGRVMQMVSQYLFDNATNKEMDYFPFLLNESKMLTDKILEGLAAKIIEFTTEAHEARTFVLNQIMVKHGRKYFEEYAVLNETTGEKVGLVWDVLSKLDEMFLFFSVTVKTTVSNRTKDDVEVIRLVEVPVVIRLYDSIPLPVA